MTAILVRLSDGPSSSAPPFILLQTPVTTIGRRGDVQIDTPAGREISKVHSVFRFTRSPTECWTVHDTQSMNGTFVNGIKICKRRLRHKDEVVFGGGPNFFYNDRLESTAGAHCRYRFFIGDPIVRFKNSVDPNRALPAINTREQCPICYEPMIEPEQLACGHSCCLLCLHEWAQQKMRVHQRPICPLCRMVFKVGDLRPPEGVIENGELRVWTVEPLLRALNILSCKTIKGVCIFKAWSEKHKKWWWKALNGLSGNLCERRIFLSLTKATIGYVIAASESEVGQAAENFGIECAVDDHGERVRRVLLFLFEEGVIPEHVSTGLALAD